VSHGRPEKSARRAAYLPPRVVIVDDDALLRESVGLVLSGLCETIGLSSGLDLEAFLENTHADLLILDVTMPGRDGFELCRALRSIPRWRSLPVLFLTGCGGDIAYERFLAVQADAYLTKPFKRNDLVETVIRLLPSE
jgi:CheY-like chemotaxis protein